MTVLWYTLVRKRSLGSKHEASKCSHCFYYIRLDAAKNLDVFFIFCLKPTQHHSKLLLHLLPGSPSLTKPCIYKVTAFLPQPELTGVLKLILGFWLVGFWFCFSPIILQTQLMLKEVLTLIRCKGEFVAEWTSGLPASWRMFGVRRRGPADLQMFPFMFLCTIGKRSCIEFQRRTEGKLAQVTGHILGLLMINK